jgi:hypothetical protein
MEDLNIEELRQLLSFYKQRVSDVEFSMLQTQIKLNKFISEGINRDTVAAKGNTEKNKN